MDLEARTILRGGIREAWNIFLHTKVFLLTWKQRELKGPDNILKLIYRRSRKGLIHMQSSRRLVLLVQKQWSSLLPGSVEWMMAKAH